MHWRNFEYQQLLELDRIAEIILSGETPNEFDKLVIARQTEAGYVRMSEGKPQMLIPFFTKSEFDALGAIIVNEFGADDELSGFDELCAGYIEGFADAFDKELPPFLSKEERIYHRYKIYPQYAVLYWLSDNGYLRYPTDEEAKRLCTLVWRGK